MFPLCPRRTILLGPHFVSARAPIHAPTRLAFPFPLTATIDGAAFGATLVKIDVFSSYLLGFAKRRSKFRCERSMCERKCAIRRRVRRAMSAKQVEGRCDKRVKCMMTSFLFKMNLCRFMTGPEFKAKFLISKDLVTEGGIYKPVTKNDVCLRGYHGF